ncbi:MAG: PKD domain-containing protein [Microthrixaceae bacterium]|nr:PKD domain-containing protein [Microthrixaceae bacterium]
MTIGFADIATYQVSLTVDDGTDTATARINIDVVNQAPVAELVVVGGEAGAEGAIQGEGNEHRFIFDASGSHDVDGDDPLTYQWDFGPGVDTTIRSPLAPCRRSSS